MEIAGFIESSQKQYLPNMSVDMVIIAYEEGRLKALLLRIRDKWLLPGGYIGKEESVDHAAGRILRERTGIDEPHLKFLAVFGDGQREFRQEWMEFFQSKNIPWREDYWFNNRFVTLTYYSLIDITQTTPVKGVMDEEIAWFDFDELPDMWMDHLDILQTARARLKEDLKHEHITHNLLPDKFTMPELHQLHQVILREKLDRSRFQKKMLASGLLERLPKLQNDTPGRNPFQYRVISPEA